MSSCPGRAVQWSVCNPVRWLAVVTLTAAGLFTAAYLIDPKDET